MHVFSLQSTSDASHSRRCTMTGRYRPKIPFEDWGAWDLDFMRARARNHELEPRWVRVEAAAMGWSNQLGHAQFGTGDLIKVLRGRPGDPDWMPSRQHVANDIRRAIDKGLLRPDSSTRCLVLTDAWAKRGKGTASCIYHHLAPASQRI